MDSITVTTDAGEVTAPLSAVKLPEGYGFYGPDREPEGYMKADRFQSEADRRAESLVKNRGYLKPDEAYSDEAIKKQLAKRGIELGDDMKPVSRLSPEQIKQVQDAYHAEHVRPLAEKLDGLRRDKLRMDLRGALTGELRDDAFKPDLPGVPSRFDAIVASLVKEDSEGRAYFEGEGGIPDYDVASALLKHVGRHASGLLADKRQHGGGLEGTASGSTGKVMAKAEFDRLDPQRQMDFMKGGGQVTD